MDIRCVLLLTCQALVTTPVATTLYTYGFDDEIKCQSIQTKHLQDGDQVMIHGRVTPPDSWRASPDCVLNVGPAANAASQHVRLEFLKFYINDCDIKLQIHEMTSLRIDAKSTLLADLSCMSYSPHLVTTKQPGNFLQLALHRRDVQLRKYNFKINMTLTEVKTESGLSIGAITGIIIALSFVGLVGAVIFIKYMCTKRALKRDLREDNRESPVARQCQTPNILYAPVQAEAADMATIHGPPGYTPGYVPPTPSAPMLSDVGNVPVYENYDQFSASQNPYGVYKPPSYSEVLAETAQKQALAGNYENVT